MSDFRCIREHLGDDVPRLQPLNTFDAVFDLEVLDEILADVVQVDVDLPKYLAVGINVHQ